MVKIRHADIAVSALLILFGAYVAYQGMGYGYIEEGNPSAGFFPFWIGLGILIFSGANLFNAVRRLELIETIGKAEIVRVALCTVAMIAFVWLSGLIGMIAAGFLLMLAIGAIFGPRNSRFYSILAVVSAAMTAILYVVFGSLLAVPLL
ncbi:tripartite tricarboxylate transporter TctB family protein [Paracoccus sp. PAR01]|uniref:tripartite tricarboxylate transporter TctB family protein n=1 Tax=Paracoccus sp. PAR01 TaxID=2769282 RepID=UPI001786F57A|nr:tripartite tricarboxylate transporter TctB family protein [Paracoccus sp. PAR01]MBD9528578.1 tripartite tricarboxylate transporter TctB family protein [Paracoccus sp. PAR01]